MTTVETDVLNEFDLDIQIDEIDETDLPARKYAPRAQSQTGACSCSWCCPTWLCGITGAKCSRGCN